MRKLISIVLICLLTLTTFAVAASATSGSYVTYEDFGAVGDGETCDFDAIYAAHAYANEHGLPVRALAGATYYLHGVGRTITIQTSTDWTDANFIVNNYVVPIGQHAAPLFRVTSQLAAIDLTDQVQTLARDQAHIDITLPQPALVFAEDNNVRHFIRRGANANQGRAQSDFFLVDENGNVCETTPILWDFNAVTRMQALPIDSARLYLTGGNFTTIEAQPGWNSPYFNRGLVIERSNVTLDGLSHVVTGEVAGQAPPNSGFLQIRNVANVTVQHTELSGRIRAVHGSYDLGISRVVNLLFYHVRQVNCIHSDTHWGIIGANEGKNVVFDNVELSRFGFHTALHNGTLRNSSIGHQGIAITGSGEFRLENTTVSSWHLLNLRSDFGSTWDGNLVIRNAVFEPIGNDAVVINFSNDGRHDFGYDTFMPRTICIDGLRIEDGNHRLMRHFPLLYTRPSLLATNHRYGNDALRISLLIEWFTTRNAPYRIALTEEISLRNVDVASGRTMRLSRNFFLFRERIFRTVRVNRLADSCPCHLR
ncbi:MAG: hypothetical protein FWB76_04020 [Oscillospiraceae bacterium]|nr:hypothetical protein [Oscillospiraceae bacterium]